VVRSLSVVRSLTVVGGYEMRRQMLERALLDEAHEDEDLVFARGRPNRPTTGNVAPCASLSLEAGS
jgi:hypothetical protein